MNRIKRLSTEVLKDNKDKFGINFDENKEILNNISTIRSKILKNELAGYITKLIKNELRIKAEKTKSVESEEQLSEDPKATNDEPKATNDEPKATNDEPKATNDEPKATNDEPKDDVVVEESSTKSELQD